MTSPDISSNLSSMMSSIREMMDLYLPDSSAKATTILTSSALAQNVFTIIKNLDYSFFATQFGVNDFPHMLSSRVAHLEATLICATSTAHNLFFAVVYTVLAVVTLGLSRNLANDCRIHWMNAVYGLASTGIGVVSILTPYYGTGLNLLFLRSIWRSFKKDYENDVYLFEGPLLKHTKAIVQKYRDVIFDFTRVKVDDIRFHNEFKPSLVYIEKEIKAAQRMDDLINLGIKIWCHFPVMKSEESSTDLELKKS